MVLVEVPAHCLPELGKVPKVKRQVMLSRLEADQEHL